MRSESLLFRLVHQSPRLSVPSALDLLAGDDFVSALVSVILGPWNRLARMGILVVFAFLHSLEDIAALFVIDGVLFGIIAIGI